MFFTSSAMVLRNRDLLDLIFGFFEPDNDRDLLWASLTSKDFLEPGLNALWRVMPHIWPIFKVLPTFNTEINSFTALVRDQHVERLLFYTRRIQELVIDFYDDNIDITAGALDVVFSVFSRLNKAAGFRSLRKLILYQSHTTDENQLVHFYVAAPNLEIVRITGVAGSAFSGIPVAVFLSSMASDSPNIKSLTIQDVLSVEAVISVLPCFRQLQTLHLLYIDCHIQRSFLEDCASSMVAIQALKIIFDYRSIADIGTPASGRSQASSAITFNFLSTLHLDGPPHEIRNILNDLQVPQLATLVVSLQSEHDEISSEMPSFFHNFMKLNGHLKTQLRAFSFKNGSFLQDKFEYFKIFSQLDSLEVTSGDCSFSTSTLANFLCNNKVWRNLTVLLLSNNTGPPRSDDGLSIAALPLLAESLYNLLNLTITIHNPDLAAVQTIETNKVRKPHGLKSVCFQCTPMSWDYSKSTAVTFASFLYRLFPKLKLATYVGSKKWITEVQEALKAKQDACRD